MLVRSQNDIPSEVSYYFEDIQLSSCKLYEMIKFRERYHENCLRAYKQLTRQLQAENDRLRSEVQNSRLMLDSRPKPQSHPQAPQFSPMRPGLLLKPQPTAPPQQSPMLLKRPLLPARETESPSKRTRVELPTPPGKFHRAGYN